VPSFLYEFAATRPEHRNLEDVRRGGFEGLRARTFDVGGPQPHPSAGASAIGARRFLIACNVNLATQDLSIAKRIARKVRASSGGFPYVKALGLELAHREQTQVSLNLTHHEVTSLDTVFEAIRDEVAREGASIADTELIGFIPSAAAERGLQFLAHCPAFTSSRILENRIAEAATGRE
jgi:glutamate formiminotransferase